MKKLLFLLFLSPYAFAANFPADISLSWQNADSYTDGTLIEVGDLTSVRVECFRQDDSVTPTFTATVPVTGEGLPQSEVFVGVIPKPGTYTCYGYSIVVDGTESDASNSADKKYIGKPLPPQTFTVN